ncbi:hypothetical protein GCM10026983_44930 [Gracilibacillus alcaliphilus]
MIADSDFFLRCFGTGGNVTDNQQKGELIFLDAYPKRNIKSLEIRCTNGSLSRLLYFSRA